MVGVLLVVGSVGAGAAAYKRVIRYGVPVSRSVA